MTNAFPDGGDEFEDPLSDYEPVEYPSEFHRVLAEQSVSTIPSKPFVQLTADSSIREAVRALADSQVSSLLVVEDEKLVGIFTERDLVRLTAEGRTLSGMTVGEAMTQPVTTFQETQVQDVFAILSLTRQHGIRHFR